MSIDAQERILKELSLTKAILLFLFDRERFKRLATKHDIAASITGASDLRQAYIAGTYKPNVPHVQELVEYRTITLRRSYFLSGLAVVVVGAASGSLGFMLYVVKGLCPVWLSALLQGLGVGVILWSTLWELGWNVRSMDGNTLPERVHQWLFRAMYSLGSALFFFAYAWSIRWY
jgi:hypothetical protein